MTVRYVVSVKDLQEGEQVAHFLAALELIKAGALNRLLNEDFSDWEDYKADSIKRLQEVFG